MTTNLSLLHFLFHLQSLFFLDGSVAELRRIKLSVGFRSSCLMSHIDGCLFVLKSINDLQNVLLNILNMLRINVSSDPADELHQDGHSVGADEG